MIKSKKILFAIVAIIVYLILADLLIPFDPIISSDRENLSALPPLSKVYELTLKNNDKIIALNYKNQGELIYYEQKFSRGEIRVDEIKSIRTLFFIFGTDNLGRDILSRAIHGGKFSLAIGIFSALFAFIIGVLIGTIAGYFSGIVDKILMRLTDIFLAFPKLFLILVIVTFTQTQTMLSLIIVLSLLNWMGISRLVRAEFLKIKEMDFVFALESIGFPRLRIALIHILPNAITPAIVSLPLVIADVIITESILSFLGFGIQPPTPTWGNMISEAEKTLFYTWWLPILPGILISLTVLMMHWISDEDN